MSDGCREVLFDWIQRREAEHKLAVSREFSGLPPEETPVEEIPDEIALWVPAVRRAAN